MAIRALQEPNAHEATLDDWSKLLLRTTTQSQGHALFGLTHMASDQRPQVAAGSAFEWGGRYYVVTENMSIADMGLSSGIMYVVLLTDLSDNPIGFAWRNTSRSPEWLPTFGGWVIRNPQSPGIVPSILWEKVVAKVEHVPGQGVDRGFFGKVIIDGFPSMWMDNPANVPPFLPIAPTQLVWSSSGQGLGGNELSVSLDEGWYHTELRGGAAGLGQITNNTRIPLGSEGALGSADANGFPVNNLSQIMAQGLGRSVRSVFHWGGGPIRIRIGAKGDTRATRSRTFVTPGGSPIVARTRQEFAFSGGQSSIVGPVSAPGGAYAVPVDNQSIPLAGNVILGSGVFTAADENDERGNMTDNTVVNPRIRIWRAR